MQGLRWERKLGTARFDNRHYLQHDVLFDLVKLNPIGGFGKGINKEIDR